MTAEQQLEEALRHARSEQFTEALQKLENVVKIPALRETALGHRAWLLRHLGRYEDALNDYRAIFETDPSRTDSEAMYADTLLLTGRGEEAFQIALDILNRNPLNAIAPKVITNYQRSRGPGSGTSEKYTALPGQSFQPINPMLDILERDENSYPTSSYPEFGRLLYWLVKCIRPAVMVETGCYVGYSSICIAQAMEDIDRGHLHSFDIFCEFPQYVSPLIGPSPDTMNAARAHLEKSGLKDRVSLYRGDSSQNIIELFERTEMQIDMAFIDGDHAIPGCFKDWNAVDRFVSPGGVVVLHDTMPVQCGWMGPRYVMEKLSADPKNYQCLALPTPEGFGIGIVQKISTREHRKVIPSVAALARHILTRGKKLAMR